MPGSSWPANEFPDLDATNHTVTSPVDTRYNCIAWAAGENIRKWWPDKRNIGFWPRGVPREETIAAFFQAYATRGYQPCFTGALEDGLEKVAVYGIRDQDGNVSPTHAAVQLPNGEWSSKLGDFEDISHLSVETLFGPVYGNVVYYLARPRPA